ncbi:MAG TPA: DNA replication/repair protein RecF [Aliidongia sp.]|nr:DNA replication/repair protein RecF [Aliidongia sp.]
MAASGAVVAMPVEAASVAVVRLDLSDFRNYRQVRLETDGRPIVLTGANGAGKTNLLEAVSFLAPGRGMRRARLAEIDRQPAEAGQGAWAVAARLAAPAGEVVIGTGRDGASETGDRRLVRIDGQPVKGQAALAQHLNLVWLTPQMDRLFQEGASPRRRFLDRLVFGYDPDHAARLAAYEQALRERARLLRQGGADPAWLGVLEDTMAREGVAIAAARRDIVQRLDRAAAEAGDGVFPVPNLTLVGAVEEWLTDSPALAAEERLRAALGAARRIDAEAGGATVGPHRSDFAVRHAGKGVAAVLCSTGEQKALLISIVLAHARLQAALRGLAPVLLLDEIAAHLDQQRRAALFETLLSLGCQAWLTGTDAVLFAELGRNAHFFTVAEGGVVAAPQGRA